MIRKDWMKGLLLGLLSLAALPSGSLTQAERTTIRKALTAQVKTLKEEGTEAPVPRVLTEATFSNPSKPDVFAFLTLVPPEGGNNVSTYLFVLSDQGKGFKIIASAPVGSAIQRIDAGWVKIQDEDIFLRSDEMADADNQNTYGEEKIYYRWHMDGTTLTQVGSVWLQEKSKFVEAKAK